MASTSTGKRKVLSLEDRIKVIRMNTAGKSCRKIAEELCVGKTQIQKIIQDKHLIQTEIASGSNLEKKYAKVRKTGNEDLNLTMFEWFCEVRSRNIPITGKLIQEKARGLAVERGMHDFKASNGWLESFKRRNNIRSAVISGEANDVDQSTVDDWTRCLSSICEGYAPQNIFNADETGLYYRALPNKSMTVKGQTNRGGKNSKERITVLLCCSATGEKMKPFIIGKSQHPRCFRGKTIPNMYAANKNSWMTSALFKMWLGKLNNKMKAEGRNILLFLDRCTAHPDVELSHVKLRFLPPNTTARQQPCDAGIIRAVKANYRTRLLRHLIFHMDDSINASDLAKKINLLNAISWLNIAWDSLTAETIINCFEKCGFHPRDSTAERTTEGK